MMRKYSILFVTLFLTIYNYSFSQVKDKFHDAYIINNANDTIYGKMKSYNPEITSRENINFWDNQDNKLKFKANELKAFYTQNLKFESIPLENSNEYALLVRLIDGPMILYKLTKHKMGFNIITGDLNSKCFDYYYIRKKEDREARFAFRKNCDHSILQVNIQPKNITRIAEYFDEIPEISDKISSKQYNASDIETLIKDYNRLHSEFKVDTTDDSTGELIESNIYFSENYKSYNDYYKALKKHFENEQNISSVEVIKKYYKNGNIKFIGLRILKSDEMYYFSKIGTWLYFRENGTLKKLIDYDLNENSGREQSFDEGGKLIN